MPVYKDIEKTKDGRQFYFKASYKDLRGNLKQYKSKKYTTKKEAELEEALFITKKTNTNRTKFEIVALDYFKDLTARKKASTVYSYTKDYNNHIKAFFEGVYIEEMDINFIRSWKDEMSKKSLSINYLNKIYVVLDNIFNFAIKNYGLNNNPVNTLGRFEKPNDEVVKDEDKLRYITHDQFEQFIKVVDDSMYNLFFTFLYYTGVRKGEAFGITWEDIDFNKNEISINKTLNNDIKGKYSITSNKTSTNRKIKMSSHLKQELTNYKNEKTKYNNFKESWFVFGDVNPLPKTTVDRYKHKYFELSGVKEITLHEFRHSHVSLLINEYVKVSKEKGSKIDMDKFFFMLSTRLGHSIEVMLKTYAHLSPDIMQDEIVDLLDNL